MAALFQARLRAQGSLNVVNARSPLFLFMRKLHKWLGLVIGLQLLIWLLSGLLMSVIDQGVAGGGDSRVGEGPNAPLGHYGDLVAPHTLSLPQLIHGISADVALHGLSSAGQF